MNRKVSTSSKYSFSVSSTNTLSRQSSIPKLQASGSVQKPPKRRSRASVDKISRVSLASNIGKTSTPCKFTPLKSNFLSTMPPQSANSCRSVDTARSSIGGKSRKCQWPLQDPSFKSKCIDLVLDFLNVYQYPEHYERATLKSPTAKQFSSIFTFIYKHIDSTYKPSLRIEEDIPKILKQIQYPISLSRSSFLNVASPHTWPSILAMLSWLVGQIQLMENCNVLFLDDLENKENLSEMFFMKLIEYSNGREEASMQDYENALLRNSDFDPEVYHKHEQELKILQYEVDNMSSLKEEISDLNDQNEMILNDKEKLLNYKDSLSAQLKNKIDSKENVQEEVMKVEEILDSINEENKNLQEIKLKQNLSDEEIFNFKQQASHMKLQFDCLQKKKDEINKEIWATEMKHGKLHHALSESIVKFNILVQNLGFETIELSLFNMEEELPIWKDDWLPYLKNEKKNLVGKKSQKEIEIASKKETLEKIEEETSVIEKNIQKMKMQDELLESEIKTEKKNLTAKEKKFEEQLDILKKDILIARKDSGHSFSEKEKEVEKAKEEVEAFKVSYEEEEARLKNELTKINEMVNNYCIKKKEMVVSYNKRMMEECDKNVLTLKKFLRHNQ